MNLKKTNKGFEIQVEGDDSNELLMKLNSLKKYWEWADKLKDQYAFYRLQEEKNISLKKAEIGKRDSSMFFSLYLAIVAQILKSFEEEPKVELPFEIREVKDRLGFNISKYGEAVCFLGKQIVTEKTIIDTIKEPNIQTVNLLHVSMGYFIDKKIQEIINKDVFPFAINKI